MRKIYRIRGSISIILLIILLPSLMFSGLMVDCARHHLAEAAIEQTSKLTLNSVLADYDTVLKNVYGLFAISQDPLLSDPVRSEQLIEQLNINMRNIILASPIPEDLRISNVLGSSYANPEVIERGILEFMKYRAPAEIGLSLLDSLEVFAKIGKQSRVAEHKMDVEIRYKDISAECLELYRAITVYDSQVLMYLNAENQLKDCICRIESFPDTESTEYMDAYNEMLRSFQTWKEHSPFDMVDYIISEGTKFSENLGQIEFAKSEFRSSVEEYGQEINNSNSDAFYNTMREEAERYDENITPDLVGGLLEQLRAAKSYMNMHSCETVEEYITASKNRLLPGNNQNQTNNSNRFYLSDNAYIKMIGEVMQAGEVVIGVPSFYITLVSTFGSDAGEREEKSDNGKSLKRFVGDINELARQKSSVEDAYIYSRHLFEGVPSGQTNSTPATFDGIDESSWYGAVSQYREMSSKVTGLLTFLERGTKELLSSLYISEYVISNFSYLTSDADQMTMTGVPIDPENNRIYGCETEYILFGNKGCAEKKFLWFTVRKEAGPESNAATAKTNVFAIRFACNTVFALTDSSINEATLAPAIAIQAASGGIFPHQLAQLTIKLALALAESAIDLDLLIKGGKVALIKSSSTWRCSAQGILNMLKDNISSDISNLVDTSIQGGVGFIQRCIDDTTVLLNSGITNSIDDISTDIEVAISAEISQTISSIMSTLFDISLREFDGIFETGYFDREKFVQKARTEVTLLAKVVESELFEILSIVLPFIEYDAINLMADILEQVISQAENPLILEGYIYATVTSELNRCVSALTEDIKTTLKDKLNEVVNSVGQDLKDSVGAYGDKLSREAVEKLTTTAVNILNRYIPTDVYMSNDITELSTEFSGTKPGRLDETILCLSYADHLQILLILKLSSIKRNEILLRVADVIQLNVALSHKKSSSFRMSEAYTYVEIEGDMKIQSLLLPGRITYAHVKHHDILGY